MVFMARRGNSLMTILLPFLCLFFIYNNRNTKTVIPTILKIVTIVLVLYLIWTNYSGSSFGIMKERMEVDSQVRVYLMLFMMIWELRTGFLEEGGLDNILNQAG